MRLVSLLTLVLVLSSARPAEAGSEACSDADLETPEAVLSQAKKHLEVFDFEEGLTEG